MQDTLADTADDAVEDFRASGAALLLPAILDLKAAAPLAAAFLERRGVDIVVDGAGVQRLGGQCLQVLLAARQSWSADARVLRISNPSPEFCAGAKMFGAGSVLFPNQKAPLL